MGGFFSGGFLNPQKSPVERVIEALDCQQRKIVDILNTAKSDKYLEWVIKYTGEATAFGSTYTTIIVTIGFASLFTVWANVKDKINLRASLWVAILGLIAVALFVAWEILQMRHRSYQAKKMIDIIRGDPTNLEQRLKDFDTERNLKSLFAIRFEYIVFILTTAIAFIAGIVLMISIAVRLYYGKF